MPTEHPGFAKLLLHMKTTCSHSSFTTLTRLGAKDAGAEEAAQDKHQ